MLQEFVWLGGTLIVVLTNSTTAEPRVYYAYSDHLNAPRVIVNAAGDVRWRWISEPFGTTAAESIPNSLENLIVNLRFPGQYFDKESGLSYNYFRDYDGTTGRYVQSDPIGLAGGINSYSYVEGDPAGSSDWNGLNRYRATLPSGSQTIESIRSYPEVVRLQGLIRDVQPGFTYSSVSSAGSNVFGYRDVQYLTNYLTNLLRTQNNQTCSASFNAYQNWARREGIAKAWEDELALILRSGRGSIDWSPAEIRQIIQTGRMPGYVGHHINSVAGSPGLASNPNNIRFTDPYSHFWVEHNGNYQTPTYGPSISR